MKSLPVLLLSVILSLGTTPLLAEEADTQRALQSSNEEVHAALQHVHAARQTYFNTVKTSGQDSPEARAAKVHLDTARDTWRTKMTHRRELRHQARSEMRHRYAGTPKTSHSR